MGNLLERFQPRLSIFASALALNSLWRQIKCSLLGVPKKRRSTDETKEIDAIVGRLREFLRLNYITGVDVARRIGVRDMTVYSWLQGESRPSRPERTTAFLKSIPAESGGGPGMAILRNTPRYGETG